MQNKKKWTAQEVEQLMILAQDCASLNAIISNAETDGDAEMGDFIEDTAPTPEELVMKADTAKILQEYMNKYLDPREIKVISMRYGFETGSPMTLEAVGECFGVTRERVRQVEMKAINKLKYRFAKNKISREDL